MTCDPCATRGIRCSIVSECAILSEIRKAKLVDQLKFDKQTVKYACHEDNTNGTLKSSIGNSIAIWQFKCISG